MGPVITAVHQNREDVLDLLLKSGCNVEESDNTKTSALCYAAVLGFEKIVRRLVERGASPTGKRGTGVNLPIHFAAIGGQIELAKYFMSLGASLLENGLDGTPVRSATIANRLEWVQWAIKEEPATLTAVDSLKVPLFGTGFEAGAIDVLQWMYSEGIFDKEKLLAMRASFGLTMVQATARGGAADLLRWLLVDVGMPADEVEENSSLTALHLAAQEGKVRCLKILVEIGKVDHDTTLENGDVTALMWASQRNHPGAIRYLCSLGIDIEKKDTSGNTALIHAALTGNLDVVKALLEAGARLDCVDNGGAGAVFSALRNSYPEVAKYLYLASKAQSSDLLTRLTTTLNQTIFHVAARVGAIEVAAAFTKDFPELVHLLDSEGNNALSHALMTGNIGFAKWLLKLSVGGKSFRIDGLPLETMNLSASSGKLEAMKFMAKRGMPLDSQENENEFTPLFYAIHANQVEVVEYLIKKGADINRFVDGQCPVLLACREGHLDIFKILMKHGASELEWNKENGESTLHMAASSGNVELVEHLLRLGLAPDLVSKKSNAQPMLHASLKGHLAVMETLERAGASFHTQSRTGWTPVYHAAASGFLDILEACQKRGLALDSVDNSGYTPALLAAYNGRINTLDYLLDHGARIVVSRNPSVANDWNPDDMNLFKLAIQGGRLELIKNLAEVRKIEPLRTYQLGAACISYTKAEILEWLVTNDYVAPDPENDEYLDPLMLACSAGYLDAVRILYKAGWSLFRKSETGHSLFWLACVHERINVAKWLLKRGANATETDNDGKTLLEVVDSTKDICTWLRNGPLRAI